MGGGGAEGKTMDKGGGVMVERAGVTQHLGPVDGPWAWVVTAATFVVHAIMYGFVFITGMYFVVFLDVFQRSLADTAWIGSLYLGVLCITGPVAAAIITRWECRATLLLGGLLSSAGQFTSAFAVNIHMLFVTFGLLTGFGHGLLLMAAVVSLNQYFRRYRVLGLGISLLGSGFGTIVYPYMTRILLNTYGWRGALMMTAGVNLHTCLVAMFVRPIPCTPCQPATAHQSNTTSKKLSTCQTTKTLFTDLHFWLLCMSNFIFVFGISVFVTHTVAYIEWLGQPVDNGVHMLSTLGVSSLIGRLVTALIGQHPQVDISLFLVICYVISGLAIISYGIWRGFLGLVLAVAVYGLFSATNGSVSAEFAAMVIGTESFATGYGYVLMWNAVGAVGGAPIAGALYDQTQYYPTSFFLAGSCMVISGLLMAPTCYSKRRLKQSPGVTSKDVNHVTENECELVSQC